MHDYIIIGGGIAGSLLAYELDEAGQKIILLNDETIPSSSKVAGGMFNPVTGKHLAKTWLADDLFPCLHNHYTALEAKFGEKFYHSTGLYRPFVNENQKKHFFKLIEKHNIGTYCSVAEENEAIGKFIENPLGGIQIKSAGWVNVPVLLSGLHRYFKTKKSYFSASFDYDKLKISESTVNYDVWEAKRIIFCEGFHVKNNPFFNWLPFNPVKGETLVIKPANGYDISEIINQGSWVIPLNEGQCRVGATYSWHDLDFEITEKAKELLKTKLEVYFKVNYEILEQQAGVRPSTTDRRPIMGKHPEFKNVLIFNGLGTKGVSLAPYFIKEYRDFLLNEKEINIETTIERFYTLYLK